ncbi:MAG: hypothetical protein JWM63_4191 [Gammaproteobacteria bacterium]|jgi:hypothetical protein|nr:hypothetical protein [Gammaproteobacteria bacterium]
MITALWPASPGRPECSPAYSYVPAIKIKPSRTAQYPILCSIFPLFGFSRL